MNWLSSLFTDTQSMGHIVLLLALVIALGYKLGKIKVGGVSLGSTFVLFTGILAGHIYNSAGLGNGEGYAAPLAVLNFVQDFGLILFVYCIGLQVGPGFFSSLKKDGLEIRPNDFVVLNTGFHRYWRINNDKYFNYYPGNGPELAYWLMYEKKIKAIAGTYGASDSCVWHCPCKEQMPWLYNNYKAATGRDIDKDYPDYEPCHRLFAQHGLMAIENAGGDIDQITGKRMTIAAFPFRCEAADGGMVRLVAWEEGSF